MSRKVFVRHLPFCLRVWQRAAAPLQGPRDWSIRHTFLPKKGTKIQCLIEFTRMYARKLCKQGGDQFQTRYCSRSCSDPAPTLVREFDFPSDERIRCKSLYRCANSRWFLYPKLFSAFCFLLAAALSGTVSHSSKLGKSENGKSLRESSS